MDYNNDGDAIHGTYAISTVHIGGYGPKGEPRAFVRSAVCYVCGGWASTLRVSGSSICSGPSILDEHVSRTTVVVMYACPEHSEQVMDALCDEFGMSSNTYDPDDLAEAMMKQGARA